MKKRIVIVDLLAIAGIAAFLVAVVLLDVKQYFFNASSVILLSFYFFGKAARDWEQKLWDKKYGHPSH